ncbi:hypothetical protein [Flindersiella endophytica]
MNPMWIPVISGAVGAGGAVAAQVVSAIFTARRENKKLAWDEKLEQERRQVERERQFVVAKREIYARLLMTINTALRFLLNHPRQATDEFDEAVDYSTLNEFFEDVDHLYSETIILNPKITHLITPLNKLLHQWQRILQEDSSTPDNELDPTINLTFQALDKLERAMRDDLGTSESENDGNLEPDG